jgi:ubiquinone/menaquinone biosynthesis C-methylase UbiE
VEHAVTGTREAYDQIAEVYAEVNSGDVPAPLLGLAREMVRHVGPGGRVIDIGCGSGRDIRWFETHGVQVIGVDLSPRMLAQASVVTAGDLLQMDMRRPAFRDCSYDGVWFNASLLHLPKRDAPGALGEVRRIIRAGGMLMVSVKDGDGESWAGGYVEGVRRFFAYYRRAEMEALLSDALFETTEAIGSSSAAHGDWLAFLCIAA